MLSDLQYLNAVKSKTTCPSNVAATLLEYIVTRRLKGFSLAELAPAIETFASNHDVSPDDLSFIKTQAESLAVANGAPVSPVIISAADLFKKEIQPPRWVIENILPAGLTILAGNPKAGKSWLALDLALSASSGGALFDALNVQQASDVLYLALEDTNFRLKSRMKKLLIDSEPSPRLELSTAWPRADEGGLEHLSGWLDNHPDAGLVIIDTLQMVRPAGAKNGNIYAEDYKAISLLKHLADEYKIAVVVVHHLRKAKSTDPFEKISGSYGLTGSADTNAVLERDPSTSNATLHIRGRDVGDVNLAMLFDKDSGRWQLLGECELPATQSQQEILQAIKIVAFRHLRQIANAS